jgi:hypothetical protein
VRRHSLAASCAVASAVACAAAPIACASFDDGPPSAIAASDAGASDGNDGATATDDAAIDDGGLDGLCSACAGSVVAPQVAHPYRLAASGGTVFWTDFTKDLWTCEAAACIPRVLEGDGGTKLKSLIGATSSLVGAIDTTCSSLNDRTEGEYVYLGDAGSVTARGVACPSFVSTRGDLLYFTNAGTIGSVHTDWSVTRCDPGGTCTDLVGSATPLAAGILLYAVATDTQVFGATSTGNLLTWDATVDAGGTLSVTTLGASFHDLATDGARIIWLDGQGVRGCDIGQCTATQRTIANDTTAQVLAADATGVYWTSKGSGPGDGKVMWLAPTATAPVAIATGQIAPVGIALDAAFVYWANASDAAGNVTKGSLWRRAKPM